MASATQKSAPCKHCGKASTRRCTNCLNPETNTETFYCSSDCLKADWPSHKAACQATLHNKPDTKRLFRAGELLQEAFLATRAELFDIPIKKLVQFTCGKMVIFSGTKDMSPGPAEFSQDPQAKAPVLSYSAGRDVFTGMMYELCMKTFEGYVEKAEEVDVQMIEERAFMRRYLWNSPFEPMSDFCDHSVIRVTLKDGSRWAVDLAGAQYRQNNPVMLFSDYKTQYVDKVFTPRPFGANAIHPERPICKRRPGTGVEDMLYACVMAENLSYQIDELEEWVFHHGPVSALLNDSSVAGFQKQKDVLVAHLATAARDYVKLARQDPTSTARPIFVSDQSTVDLSEEQKGRLDRKRGRKVANMSPDVREHYESAKAKGTFTVMM
ncbi:hypothetical protein Q7P37_000998 [Cladosporium fusiforme]